MNTHDFWIFQKFCFISAWVHILWRAHNWKEERLVCEYSNVIIFRGSASCWCYFLIYARPREFCTIIIICHPPFQHHCRCSSRSDESVKKRKSERVRGMSSRERFLAPCQLNAVFSGNYPLSFPCPCYSTIYPAASSRGCKHQFPCLQLSLSLSLFIPLSYFFLQILRHSK